MEDTERSGSASEETHHYVSHTSLSSPDAYAANPRFRQLQEELRYVLFTAVASHGPSRCPSPTRTGSELVETAASKFWKQSLDSAQVPIPKARLIYYLKNWITECAPHLDKFDENSHFGVQIPILAQNSPSLLYAILAFSARQSERKACFKNSRDSLELYQESIRLLTPYLQTRDPNVLMTACILACMELMSVSARGWRRHVEGCAALFDSYMINGFSGGHLQAVFWCYARMELCGVIISDGTESTVLPLDKWVPQEATVGVSPDKKEDQIRDLFYAKGSSTPDMHANWAVYLCTKTCNLTCRRSRSVELGEVDQDDPRPFSEQWVRLWEELQFWREHRHPAMLPVKATSMDDEQTFPNILFAHWAAISGNQLYHTACIMMLEMKPLNIPLSSSSPYCSAIWHARRVCGISLTNPHSGSLINAIQPLYIAGKLLTHWDEHLEVARLFRTIESTTGWGALWRLRDLEQAWGYEANEILSAI
ncbi:uncharacterized protein BHQ10_005220 [Talaromyces amestolkiae]|uniref:Transcription factor domain-containing protein n=1 Tax=Talaromyces amestolkiae TaxID=1196081 RepID=A0A364L091_TALAM|nr:uncharacterized protein BHQ10_005220 [Talaromyces amestolkiae]RAO69208.1 hypothetical protein BHQ10_005220 [Talaromyces amestolkiae]